MEDARSDNVLSDSEIRLLLEASTNEDGFELLKLKLNYKLYIPR